MTHILGEVWLRARLESGHPIVDTPELRAALADMFTALDELRRDNEHAYHAYRELTEGRP